MAHSHALVEDETFAAPQAFIFRHFLEVFQDATFQVVNLLDAFSLEEGGRFLATDAAGAEHGNLGGLSLTQQPLAFTAEPAWELAESCRLRINGAFEGTSGHFVVVSGVDHD